jgi:hypothetical protein
MFPMNELMNDESLLIFIAESSEPLHVYIGGLNVSAVTAAKELMDNLLETVRAKYRQFWLHRRLH